jgi:probable rRNA maturation factor
MHGCDRCTLSVALVDDATMADLHERFLGVRKATDVLAFNLREPDSDFLEGEIVISTETAAREGSVRGHPASHETLLYTVHGILHLLGYDDQTDREARQMHAEEDRILIALGTGPVYGTYLG